MTNEIDLVDDGDLLFQSLVDATEELRELWRKCSRHPAFIPEQVLLTTDFRRYVSGSTLEFYVDCEAKSGKAFAWCTDVRKDNLKWTVERTVRMNAKGGQRVIVELTGMKFTSSRALALSLPQLVKELVATLDDVDLNAS
jgi:hypothetical protein